MNKDKQQVYEIRIKGKLSDSWSAWFDGLEIKNDPNSNTVIRGVFIDQASLFGTLTKIQALNLTLLSVNRTDLKNYE